MERPATVIVEGGKVDTEVLVWPGWAAENKERVSIKEDTWEAVAKAMSPESA